MPPSACRSRSVPRRWVIKLKIDLRGKGASAPTTTNGGLSWSRIAELSRRNSGLLQSHKSSPRLRPALSTRSGASRSSRIPGSRVDLTTTMYGRRPRRRIDRPIDSTTTSTPRLMTAPSSSDGVPTDTRAISEHATASRTSSVSAQAPLTNLFLEDGSESRFSDGGNPRINFGDLGWVDVDTDHAVSITTETRGRDATNITHSEHSDIVHYDLLGSGSDSRCFV